MQRVSVVGTTGSGKTTLARAIGERLHLPHVELDALHWGADWTPLGTEKLLEAARVALSGDRWVTDGNYGNVRRMIWERADTVIWLDYPLSLVLKRLISRTVRRIQNEEVLWGGCRESWGRTLSRDSILLWALKTHSRRRRSYIEALADPACASLQRIRFTDPRDADRWLTELTVPV